jgi:hypothetical protein
MRHIFKEVLMERIIPITQDEMSYPDWKQRLSRAQAETRKGKGIELDQYLKHRNAPRK